jgi:hypothetical protein
MSSLVPGPSPTEPEPADDREDSTTWLSAAESIALVAKYAALSTAATATAKVARALGSGIGEAVAARLECDARRTAEAAVTALALAAVSLTTPERKDGET